MSGGVDSSVSAALLKEQGYDVTGVFLNVWQPDFIRCSRGDDRIEAMRAAARLGIQFLTFDFEDEYKRGVVDYMIAEYRAGRTPNPDVMCNRHVKFGAFLKKALAVGADYIATGHYARVERENSKYKLFAGTDTGKDQSYFLWTLTQEQLSHALFPVGDLRKTDVRELAKKFGLPNAEREESQGLCFVGEFDMSEFLEHFIPKKVGDVLDENGEVIGSHEGAFHYTLGQRHGFEVWKRSPIDGARYCVAKDIEKNTITVSFREIEIKTASKEVSLRDAHFIAGVPPDLGKKYAARIRYRQPLQACRLATVDGTAYVVVFDLPQRAVTPGQSLVLYDGKECLGGAVIKGSSVRQCARA